MIADEHAGLAAAVRRFLPEVRRFSAVPCWPRSRIACRKRVAREVAAVFRAPGLARRSAWPRSRRAGTRNSPRQSTCLSGAHGRHPVLRVPRAPLGPTAHHEQPRGHTEIKRDPERRRLPRPPHHCGCSKDYCGLERTSWISRFSNRRRSPRQPNRSIDELPLTFTHNSGLDPFSHRRWATALRGGGDSGRC